MKNRTAIYQREAAEMLHNISQYPGLTEEQLCRFFPKKESTEKLLLAHMLKSILDVIALYCMKDDTGALCDLYHTTRFSYTSCTMISVMPKKCFPVWLSTQIQPASGPPQFREKS